MSDPVIEQQPAAAPAGPAKAKNGLGLAALIVGIVAFIFAVIPFLSFVAWVPALVAIGLGIAGLVVKNKKRVSAVAGLALGALAIIVGIVVSIASVAGVASSLSDQIKTTEVPAASDADPSAAPADEEVAAAPKAQELVVSEVAFGRNTDSDYWWYAAVIDNPNTDYVFASSSVTVEAVDADGVILDSSPAYLTILPGKTAITGSFLDIGSEQISAVNVRGPVASTAVSAPVDKTGSFTLSPVELGGDDYTTTVAGTVTSAFSEEQTYVNVVVIARDGGGQIVNAQTAYIERLPSGGTARFEANFYPKLPDGLTFEAYASL